MILNHDTPFITNFSPNKSYLLRCNHSECFHRDVSVVWDFIRHSTNKPICITLLPQSVTGESNGSHLEQVGEVCGPNSTLSLLTSGTTGVPKKVRRVLTLPRKKSTTLRNGERWLLAYAPFRWAGISVMLHVFTQNADLVVPSSLEISDLLVAAKRYNVSHISLTPSMLRKIVLATSRDELSSIPLVQITFGGEAVNQPVLDLAQSIWPKARLTHVYAATEFGDICSVSDGLSGIPRYKLDRPGFSLSTDGELVISGLPTGDLWVLKGERYYFLGRREEIINVGGAKVSPHEVESAALNIDGITEARAYAVTSPLVGQVVGLEYCGSVDVVEVRNRLRIQLPKPAWPVELNKIERIRISDAGKLSRGLVSR